MSADWYLTTNRVQSRDGLGDQNSRVLFVVGDPLQRSRLSASKV